MYRATITCRLSRIDQENVSSKVDQWKSRYDREKLYFRPHLHEDTHENDVQQNSEIDSEMKDEGTEESVYLTRHRKSRDGKTLLFVHQTTWQRQLLKRYADVHCMLVRRYILNHQVPPPPAPAPLFFVAVKTNVDYQIVASFVTHDETTESITEALGVLRQWNPGWSAGYLFHRSLRTGNQCYREYLKSCDSFTVSCFQIRFNGKEKLYIASLVYKFSGKSLMLNKK